MRPALPRGFLAVLCRGVPQAAAKAPLGERLAGSRPAVISCWHPAMEDPHALSLYPERIELGPRALEVRPAGLCSGVGAW